MATLRDVIRQQLDTGGFLMDSFTKDLTDAEYFTPAVEGANHAAWIVGHIACTEDWFTSLITGSEPKIDKKTHELFNGNSECKADASCYPSRREIDEMFKSARANAIEALSMFDESRWEEESPEGMPKELFPTVGSVWGMMGVHQFWHIGQQTTNRVALKKPRVLTG